MTFSEFIKMLYKYIGGDTSRVDFMIELTTEIMKEPFEDERHPLECKSQDMLGRIFNGTKDLPRKDARVILSNLDKDRFDTYMISLSDDAVHLIGEAMQQNGVTIVDNDARSTCTDLFVSILEECVGGVGLSATKTASEKNSTNDTKNKKAFKTGTPSEQMRAIFVQAIKDYSIASFMCNLPNSESESEDVVHITNRTKTIVETVLTAKMDISVEEFARAIKADILSKFVDNQNDELYIKIKEFTEKLAKFKHDLNNLDRFRSFGTSESNHCIDLFRSNPNDRDFISTINKEKEKLDHKLIEEKEKAALANWDMSYCLADIGYLEHAIETIESLELIYLNRLHIDSIYGEICDGKTLFVF